MCRRFRSVMFMSVAVAMAAGGTATAVAAVHQPAATRDAKKGVGAWVFNGVHSALIKSGASWYYTWGTDHPGIASPRGFISCR